MPASGKNRFDDPELRFVGEPLRWASLDLEQWFGVRGGRFTQANLLFTGIAGALIAVIFYLALIPAKNHPAAAMFTQRGAVQYVTVYFFCWCSIILLVKWQKLSTQRRALRLQLVPATPDFELTPTTVGLVLKRLEGICDEPRRFYLLNRIKLALANLRNMGQLGDFEGVLSAQASADEDVMESSYSLVRGLNWAIPVLGFIGTVQGLSTAVSGFGGVLAETGDVSAIKSALQGVAGGLAVAFETTLVALVAALIIQLGITLVKRLEEQLLDDCREYCQRELASRLRLTSGRSIAE